jgi:hypothetical protein
MRLQLLGTGCSDGGPIPVHLRVLHRRRRRRVVRGQTSALLDDRLLLDIGADGSAPALPARDVAGGVRVVPG